MKVFFRLAVFILTVCVLTLALSESKAHSIQIREVRVVNAIAAAGQTVNVSVELVSQGDENAIGFSLNFNQAIFTNPVVTLGGGAAGASLNANTNQAANGRVGVVLALSAGQTFSAGVRQIVNIAFNVAASAPTGAAAITFGDQPVVSEISDASANVLTTIFTNGVVTVSQQNPAPAITSLNPTSAIAGGAAFTLIVNGTNFINGSTVQWNGANRATTFVNSAQITAAVTANDIAGAGTAIVTVVNPAPGGGTSNAVSFAITSQPSAQIAVNPANPTRADNISIRLSGVWPNACIPQNPQLSVTGTDLRIDVSNPAQVCATVLTDWSLNVPVGMLPIGAYTVRVIHTADGVQRNLGQSNFTVSASPVASVSAASFLGDAIAPESVVAAFGVNLATGVASAGSLPLPTELAGTRVMVKDGAGMERPASLFFVAPMQVNYLIPANTVAGVANVTVISGDNKISIGSPQIANVAPGLFAANANGQGVAAATVLRIKQSGELTFEPISQFDSTLNRFVSIPIDLGPESDQLFLVLFGTGFRFRSAQSAVSVKIGGTDAEVLFAGLSPDFVGLDQCNVRLPRSLAGRGEIDVAMTVDGKTANMVKINVK